MQTKHGYFDVGPLHMYFDEAGTGRPLLLLHGGISNAAALDGLRAALAVEFRTFAVEQQGHGHTNDADRPLEFERMADDTAAVLSHLGVSDAEVFGWSDGGNVALALAIRHPALVRRAAICGTNTSKAGLTKETLDYLTKGAAASAEAAAAHAPKVMRESYESMAPDPSNWGRLVKKVMEQAVAFRGWTAGELAGITAPVLVMVGDRDAVTVEHAVATSRAVGQGSLAVLPDTDHMAPMSRANWVVPMLQSFFGQK
jgi:pimeloyl-ACP methyl ester carboxylesterase